jgi:sulfite exporter TauE/SafE
MAAFGVGTLPALLAAGAAGAQVGRLLRRAWVRRTAGVLVALAGAMHVAGSAKQWRDAREAAPAACCHGEQASSAGR